MASFCHFWRITPEQFWNLDLEEYFALVRYMRRHEARMETHRSGRARLRR